MNDFLVFVFNNFQLKKWAFHLYFASENHLEWHRGRRCHFNQIKRKNPFSLNDCQLVSLTNRLKPTVLFIHFEAQFLLSCELLDLFFELRPTDNCSFKGNKIYCRLVDDLQVKFVDSSFFQQSVDFIHVKNLKKTHFIQSPMAWLGVEVFGRFIRFNRIDEEFDSNIFVGDYVEPLEEVNDGNLKELASGFKEQVIAVIKIQNFLVDKVMILLVRSRYLVKVVINLAFPFNLCQVLVQISPLKVKEPVTHNRTQLQAWVQVDVFFTAYFDCRNRQRCFKHSDGAHFCIGQISIEDQVEQKSDLKSITVGYFSSVSWIHIYNLRKS